MITLLERARRYAASMPAAVSGSGGHNATFSVACALIKGFDLSVDEARPILHEFNGRCSPQWSEADLEHKLKSAFGSPDDQPRGYLIGDRNDPRGSIETAKSAPPRKPEPKPEYDPEQLTKFAGDWAKQVDLCWLANRSVYDPAEVNSDNFLSLLYGSREKVICFTKEYTQGQAVWPDETLPETGRCGVWFLAQPVDGGSYPNPRTQKMSRRSEESVVAWRYLVLESDDAPLREWLGAIAQLPLRIAAIYSSGGRSVHALVQVDAATKKHWDDLKVKMAPGLRFLILNGADAGVLSAVRLTRLPGCFREGKMRKDGTYERFAVPKLQKLLYLNTNPEARPLIDIFPKRDVEEEWLKTAAIGLPDNEPGEDWIKAGLTYYAPVSARIRECLKNYGREE